MNRDAIAKELYKLNPAIQLWNGDPYEFEEAIAFDLPAYEHHVRLAYAQADAVIALLAS